MNEDVARNVRVQVVVSHDAEKRLKEAASVVLQSLSTFMMNAGLKEADLVLGATPTPRRARRRRPSED